jgi:hypothetical protein
MWEPKIRQRILLLLRMHSQLQYSRGMEYHRQPEATRDTTPENPRSLLMASAWARVAGALVLSAALWLAVGWALR